MPAAIGEPTRKPIAWAAEWMLTYLPLAFVPPLLFSKAGLLHLIAPLVLVAAARSWAGLVSGRSGCGFRGAALARWDRSIAGPRDNGRPCPLPPCSARGLDRGRKFIDQRARPCVCVFPMLRPELKHYRQLPARRPKPATPLPSFRPQVGCSIPLPSPMTLRLWLAAIGRQLTITGAVPPLALVSLGGLFILPLVRELRCFDWWRSLLPAHLCL